MATEFLKCSCARRNARSFVIPSESLALSEVEWVEESHSNPITMRDVSTPLDMATERSGHCSASWLS